jgi:protein-S-isoprenylcysteine O-methyltransferase Ste14
MTLFRVATDAPAWRHVAATLAQTVVFWTVFLFVLPELVEQVEHELGSVSTLHDVLPHARTAGAMLFALGGALGLWSGLVMALRGRGTPLPTAAARQFVVSGPYRVIRNPMALGGIAQGVAVGLWRGSPAVVLYALAGAVLWHCVARPAEERFLAARFGPTFTGYRDRVPLWLPRLLPRRGERVLAVALLALTAYGAFLGVLVLAFALADILYVEPRHVAHCESEHFAWTARDLLAPCYALAPLLGAAAALGALLWTRSAPPAVTAATPRTP